MPDLMNEFNGASGLMKGLVMWLFGMKDDKGREISFMDLIKTLFSPDSAPPGNADATPPPATTSTPPPAASSTAPSGRKVAHNVVLIGDSLAEGYGAALTREFGAANVTNYGRVSAGLLGGIHLKDVDWSKVNKDTVAMISVGTNDVGFLSAKNPERIREYADQVMALAKNVTDRGGTPVLVAMRAPDKPESYRGKDGVMHTQTDAEFAAFKQTLNAMNDAIAKAAAERGVAFVTQEGGQYVGGGVHQTAQGYQNTADNALKQAGVTVITNA